MGQPVYGSIIFYYDVFIYIVVVKCRNVLQYQGTIKILGACRSAVDPPNCPFQTPSSLGVLNMYLPGPSGFFTIKWGRLWDFQLHPKIVTGCTGNLPSDNSKLGSSSGLGTGKLAVCEHGYDMS